MENATEATRKIEFIEKVLPRWIVEQNEDFKNYEVINCRAELNKALDGFVSTIYEIQLTLRQPNEEPQVHNIILKIMKGDENFRTLTKSNLVCKNEIYMYKTVLPFFNRYLKDNNVTLFNPDEWWAPRVYFADYGLFPELNDGGCEAILALENLKSRGFRMGPRIDLDEQHLRLMIKNIALYHSTSFAMRIRGDPRLKELASSLAKFSFLSESGEELGSYKRLVTVGFERLINCVENNPEHQHSKEFVANVKRLKKKHFEKPMVLMETFLKHDEVFSIMLHGDYVRNNVLFQYDEPEGFENPKAIKMYDFQETRYASIAIDLFFFMYMNIHDSLRDKVWDQLLQFYHDTLMESLTHILKCERSDERLKPYSFDNFLDHFKKHAFYGVAVSLYYVSWIASPEDELEKINYWFETDMNGEEFQKISQTCGGADVDKRIVSIAKHASDSGYMNIL